MNTTPPSSPAAHRPATSRSPSPVTGTEQAPTGQQPAGSTSTRTESPRPRLSTGSALSALSGTTRTESAAPVAKQGRISGTSSVDTSARLFNDDEVKALKDAKKVLVVGYSSTGGGHTARCLDPVLQAAKKGSFDAGDCIVIHAPTRWEHDKNGAKVKVLHTFAKQISLEGEDKPPLHVFIKQSDKSVTGLYEESGNSDNVRMFRDFIEKPQRDTEKTPLSIHDVDPKNPEPQLGQGHSAKSLLKAVIEAVGRDKLDRIAVLTDMAPDLQKAAVNEKVSQRLEIGNHQGLFIGAAKVELGAKDLAYVHKASGSGHANKLHLVEYDRSINVVPGLADAMHHLGITEGMTKTEARTKVLTHLLKYGNRLNDTDWNQKTLPNGIFVGKGVGNDASNVKAMIYLYVNEYTRGAAQHVHEQMAQGKPGFDNAVVALCGGNAVKEPPGLGENEVAKKRALTNILPLMYAANADGVTNAGFGTTSEYYYMAHHGYAGDFVAFPVVHQHEQEANAAQLADDLKRHFQGERGPHPQVEKASSPKEMYEKIDAMVRKRDADPNSHLAGSIDALLKAANKEGSGAAKAADLIQSLFSTKANGEPAIAVAETANAIKAKEAMAEVGDIESKQHRRLYKLAAPALIALSQGKDICLVQATKKRHSEPKTVYAVKDLLSSIKSDSIKTNFDDGNKKFHDLMWTEGSVSRELSESSRAIARELYDALDRVLQVQDSNERRKEAIKELEQLTREKIALGW